MTYDRLRVAWEVADLFQCREDLEQIVGDLRDAGIEDAAVLCAELLYQVRKFEAITNPKIRDLGIVWRAMDKRHDYNDETFQQIIAEWRAEQMLKEIGRGTG